MKQNTNFDMQANNEEFDQFLRSRRFQSCSDDLALRIVTAAQSETSSKKRGALIDIVPRFFDWVLFPQPMMAFALMLFLGIGAGTQLGDGLGVGLADFDSSFIYFEGDFAL